MKTKKEEGISSTGKNKKSRANRGSGVKTSRVTSKRPTSFVRIIREQQNLYAYLKSWARKIG